MLGDLWAWWARTLGDLDDASWHRPTRLGGWDVAALTAHHAMLVQGLEYLAMSPVDEPVTTPLARDMLRRFNAPSGLAATLAGDVADRARTEAASTPTSEFVELFRVIAPAVIAATEDGGPVVIDYFGNGTFPIAEALSIMIMESVVHGLDLAAAVPAASPLPPDGVAFSAGLLASIAEPIALIEAATGRSTAAVLPVLR
jgi:uncharacterized protein (TIGR03083 family)